MRACTKARSATPIAGDDLVGRIGEPEFVKVMLMHVQPAEDKEHIMLKSRA